MAGEEKAGIRWWRNKNSKPGGGGCRGSCEKKKMAGGVCVCVGCFEKNLDRFRVFSFVFFWCFQN